MFNRDHIGKCLCGASINDVIDNVTRLYDRHTRDVTIFQVVALGNYDPDETIRVDSFSTHYRRTLYLKIAHSA